MIYRIIVVHTVNIQAALFIICMQKEWSYALDLINELKHTVGIPLDENLLDKQVNVLWNTIGQKEIFQRRRRL